MSSASLPSLEDAKEDEKEKTPFQKFRAFLNKNFFLLGLVFVVLLGIFVPEIGHKEGPLNPPITASWIAVILIFLISGLGVKSRELRRATLFWQLNLFVHLFIFVFYPLIGLLIRGILLSTTELNKPLLDGLLITLCLPTTISSAVVLTLNAQGNEAAAVINTAMANMLGIILTPGLILIFLGNLGSVSIGEIFFKLTMRVIVPFVFGQLVRNYDHIKNYFISLRKDKENATASGTNNNNNDNNNKEKEESKRITMVKRITKHKAKLKRLSEILLLFIVFCAISESFYTGVDANIGDVFAMLFIVICLHCLFLVIVWNLSGISEKRKNYARKQKIEKSQKNNNQNNNKNNKVTINLNGENNSNNNNNVDHDTVQISLKGSGDASSATDEKQETKNDPKTQMKRKFTSLKSLRDVTTEDVQICLGDLFDFNIYDRIAILFCATQKTAAFGVPMITTLYEQSDNLGLYTVPLLLFHPMQLVIDSFLVQPLKKRVAQFEKIYGKDYFSKKKKYTKANTNDNNNSNTDDSPKRLNSTSAAANRNDINKTNHNNNNNNNDKDDDSIASDKDYDDDDDDDEDRVMLGGGLRNNSNDHIVGHTIVDDDNNNDNNNNGNYSGNSSNSDTPDAELGDNVAKR